jgi:nitrilase
MHSVPDKLKNVEQADRLARQAIARDGSDFVTFPEHFDWSGGSVADKVAAGEKKQGGPAYAMCRQLAVDHGIHVHTGSFYEAAGNGKVLNTSVVFDPSGAEIARYSKIHLFDIVTPDGLRYGESDAVQAGREVVVADLGCLRLGLAICYDLRFPELFQELVRRGAQMIVLPAAFTLQTGKDHWDVLCRARAIETQTYFLAPAQYGSFDQEGQLRHNYGHTLVCDPWGHIIAKASDGVGWISAFIEPQRITQARAQIPLAAHKVL